MIGRLERNRPPNATLCFPSAPSTLQAVELVFFTQSTVASQPEALARGKLSIANASG